LALAHPVATPVGNGYVYSSDHIGDSAALDDLLSAVVEKPTADPRFLRFVTGRRKLLWNRNCVALDLPQVSSNRSSRPASTW